MSHTDRGRMAHFAGASAENSVLRDYQANGATVMEQRWRGQGGEIDLVMQDGDETVFVEVKKSRDFATAAQRISHHQMARIMSAAEEYMTRLPNGMISEVRFDVALVNAQGQTQIVRNAFGQF